MGKAYKIQCKHCGTQFVHSADSGYGVLPTCIGCGDSIERESVVKCPMCQRRLNSTKEELREQVVEETYWD
ncbi:MAG: hypothetical protein R3Y16_00570 [Rikenellaceae bacterium]